jgi:hypothetical protein
MKGTIGFSSCIKMSPNITLWFHFKISHDTQGKSKNKCASLGWSYAKGLPPSSNEWTVIGTRPIVCILLTKYNEGTIVLMWKWVSKYEATILSQLSQQCELKFYRISPWFIYWDQNIQSIFIFLCFNCMLHFCFLVFCFVCILCF